jgi:hypothetical protein
VCFHLSTKIAYILSFSLIFIAVKPLYLEREVVFKMNADKSMGNQGLFFTFLKTT